MSDSHDFATVEKTRMTRCLWCGTLASQKWIKAEISAGYYCSRDCARAGGVEFRQQWIRILTPCGIVSVIVGIIAVPLYGFELTFSAVVAGISMICLSALCSNEVAKGQEVRSRIQKGSRRDDRSLDLVLLEKAKASALCPNCGANLILAEIGPDRIFKCKYCGAEGIIEWPLDDEDMREDE